MRLPLLSCTPGNCYIPTVAELAADFPDFGAWSGWENNGGVGENRIPESDAWICGPQGDELYPEDIGPNGVLIPTSGCYKGGKYQDPYRLHECAANSNGGYGPVLHNYMWGWGSCTKDKITKCDWAYRGKPWLGFCDNTDPEHPQPLRPLEMPEVLGTGTGWLMGTPRGEAAQPECFQFY